MDSRPTLILTADDFGASVDVNKAIVQAHREGVLRFAGLMVGEAAAQDAVQRVRAECSGLGVGLHLTLCAGKSVLPPRDLPGLVNEEGRFRDDPILCGLRYFFDRSVEDSIEKEMRAQFERFLSLGLKPLYVDGHVNIQAHPVIFPKLMRLAREYGFFRVRLPGGDLDWAGLRAGATMARIVEGIVVLMVRKYLLRVWGDPRIVVPDRVYGLLRSGLMKEDYVIDCLRGLSAGTIEMYFHPSCDPGSVAHHEPVETHRSISELETLLSPGVRQAIESLGIRLLDAQTG